MRVVCIDGKNIKGDVLIEGESYFVEPQKRKFNKPAYFISQFNSHFDQSRFIPLSDIDEKEMEREWMLTPVELPNQVN